MKKGKELLKAFDYIDDEYLDLVEEMRVKKNKIWWKSGVAAAAIVGTLSTASIVAFASNAFGIKDLIIPNNEPDTEVVVTEEVINEKTTTDTQNEKTATNPAVAVSYTYTNDGFWVLEIQGDEMMSRFTKDTPEGMFIETWEFDHTVDETKRYRMHFDPYDQIFDIEEMYEGMPAPEGLPSVAGCDFISMSGFSDSPNAKALAEWNEFLSTYDEDGSICDANNYADADTWGEDVKLYNVYSDEMADKLREIVAKYDLGLHKETGTMPFSEFEEYFGGKIIPDESECYGAYYYDDGTVHFDSSFYDEEGLEISYQFSRIIKGIFDESYLNIGISNDYVQEDYTTKDGTKVLLALSKDKAIIIIDKENSFSVVNVLTDWYGKEENGEFVAGEFTMDKLKKFADTFDFSLLK